MIHHDALWTLRKLVLTAPMIMLTLGSYTAISMVRYP